MTVKLSSELMRQSRLEDAVRLIDDAIADAKREDASLSVKSLCRHAAVIRSFAVQSYFGGAAHVNFDENRSRLAGAGSFRCRLG